MPGARPKMMTEYDLGLRFHKQPTMTDKQIFNTFASVIDCPSASPFFKKLAQAGLVAMPEDKAMILKTWPRLMMNYGPHSTRYTDS